MKFLFAAIILFAAIYGASAQTGHICNTYSMALNLTNEDLITTIVNDLVGVALGSPLAIYFNGTKPAGSTNFATNSAAAGVLVAHLVQFFALPVAFNCTDGTIGEYEGRTDMAAVHQPMMIGAAESTAFNDALIDIMAGYGVSQADQTATRNLLNSFTSAIVYNPPMATPTAAPTRSPSATTPSSSGAASVVASVGLVALAALF
jgi:hypothetical protein